MTYIEKIETKSIISENSFFLIKGLFTEDSKEKEALGISLKKIGIVDPLTVYRDNKGDLHLIDGMKRHAFALDNGVKELYISILPEITQLTDIITLILYTRREDIGRSIINKIEFICFALSLNVPDHWIFHNLCKPLGLRPHRTFLDECLRIRSLPGLFKEFCHEKRFSYKQILNLTHHPVELLEYMMKQRHALQLTASVLDELSANIKDYIRANNISFQDFISNVQFTEILNSDLNPSEKTRRLREFIRTLRFPILTKVNSNILKITEELELPENIQIRWDETLENKSVEIVVKIENIGKWGEVLQAMNSSKTKEGVKDILKEL